MFKAKSLKSAPAATLEPLFGSLDSIARQTGFAARTHRKISPAGLLMSLLKSVCCGQASLNQLAMFVGYSDDDAPSRQAVHKRLGKTSSAFLQGVLNEMLLERVDSASQTAAFHFGRILVQDSAQFTTYPSNHESYPGFGNCRGITAGCKVDTSFDLVSMQPVTAQQGPATTQDRVLGPKLTDSIQANDLVLRDMGYFSLASFKLIEQSNAFWLSRLPTSVKVTLPDNESLERYLKRTRRRTIDLQVVAGREVQHHVRLVAVRVSDDVYARRRRQRRAKSKSQGHTPRSKSLFRDKWSIYVTNIDAQQLCATAVTKLYGLRWSVEIEFRAWKQSTKVQAALNRITNQHHLEALILASLIFHVLTLRLIQGFQQREQGRTFSSEKTADWLAIQILAARSFDDPLFIDLRHLSHERRKRSLLIETLSILRSLS